MKTAAKLVASLLLTGTCLAQALAPKDGYVPDEKTAIKIAEAILAPIYGEKQIEEERPFHAELEGNVWKVEGTLHCMNCDGGVAEIRIDKHTGTIVSYIHGK